MKKKLIGALTIALAGTMALGLAACGGDKTKVNDDIVNGGFEQGLKGWTKTGTAFSQAGVVETDEAGENKLPAGKAGDAFFSGYEAGNPQFTGTLTSDYFKLGGTGKIGFLMGGGMSADKCYVEFFEQGNDTALAKVSNDAFALGYITDQMVRVVVDLSEHIGKTVCIKITDNDKGDADEYAYLNLDDFVVYKTEEDVSKAQKERADKLAAIGKPAFSETETDTTIKNGDFEEGLENWLLLEGDAFGSRALCTDSEFWGEQHRSYNKQGDKFLNTYFDESATGSVRSTKFTLAGDGIISFLMAGPKNKGSYVAVCDGKTDEELAKVTFNEYFNDPNLCENMVRHYVKLDDKIGEVLYIKVVDGEKSEFAGIMVDDFKVSMVEAHVKAQMKADYEWSLTLGSDPVALATQNYYSSYENYPYELTVLRFEKKVAPQAVYEGNVDLKEILGGAKAVYDSSVTEEDFTYSITGVEKDGEAVAVPNESALAVTEGVYTVRYKVECKGQVLEESFLIGVYNTHDVLNGGFELGAPAGWTVVEGNVNTETAVSDSANGWTGAPYNQAGNYHFDGAAAAAETEKFKLRSSDFVLEGAGLISFKLGGRAGKLSVYEKTSGMCLAQFTNTEWNDDNNPHAELGCRNLTMTTYYFDLSAYKGMTLYIEVADTESDNWGIVHFDDVVTYYPADTTLETLAAKQDAVAYSVEGEDGTFEMAWVVATNAITPDTLTISARTYDEIYADDFDIEAYLSENIKGGVLGVADPTFTCTATKITCDGQDTTSGFDTFTFEAGKTYEVTYKLTYSPESGDPQERTGSITLKVLHSGQIRNGGFELGDMTGWTTATEGFKTDTAVIGDATYWGEELPYNQSGNYHLDGFDTHSGIAEAGTWSVKSETFVLGGAGIITVKMGGRAAAVRVYKVDGDEETLIGYYKQSRSIDQGTFPNVSTTSWADMATYVIDLHDYIDETLRIELCDEEVEGGWANAFFDEVVTYYEGDTATVKAALLKKKDTVNNSKDQTPETVEIPWVEATNSAPAASDDTAD